MAYQTPQSPPTRWQALPLGRFRCWAWSRSVAAADDRGVRSKTRRRRASRPWSRAACSPCTPTVCHLAEVLRAIGEAGAFEVVLRGAFAAPVHELFADQLLEDSVRRLVEGAFGDRPSTRLRILPPATAGLAEIRVVENPALAASEDATPDDPAGGRRRRAAARRCHRRAAAGPRGVPAGAARGAAIDPGRRSCSSSAPPTRPPGSRPSPRSARSRRAPRSASSRACSPRRTTRRCAAAPSPRSPGSTPRARAVCCASGRWATRTSALRMQALNALASSERRACGQHPGRALHQDPEPEVRISAIRALGRVGGDWARRYLVAGRHRSRP